MTNWHMHRIRRINAHERRSMLQQITERCSFDETIFDGTMLLVSVRLVRLCYASTRARANIAVGDLIGLENASTEIQGLRERCDGTACTSRALATDQSMKMRPHAHDAYSWLMTCFEAYHGVGR